MPRGALLSNSMRVCAHVRFCVWVCGMLFVMWKLHCSIHRVRLSYIRQGQNYLDADPYHVTYHVCSTSCSLHGKLYGAFNTRYFLDHNLQSTFVSQEQVEARKKVNACVGLIYTVTDSYACAVSSIQRCLPQNVSKRPGVWTKRAGLNRWCDMCLV